MIRRTAIVLASVILAGCGPERDAARVLASAASLAESADAAARETSFTEAVDGYAAALAELDRLQQEFPDSTVAARVAADEAEILGGTATQLRERAALVDAMAAAEGSAFHLTVFAVSRVEDEGKRSKHVDAIAHLLSEARSHADAEEYRRALEAVEGIEDPDSRSAILAQLALRLAESGQPLEAARYALDVELASARSEALATIAAHLAEAGDDSAALDAMSRIDAPSQRDEARAAIVEHQARRGSFDAALDGARRIDGAGHRTRALAAVAQQLVARSDAVLGEAVFAEARDVAASAPSSHQRDEALAAVVAARASGGAVDEAVRVASGISSESTRSAAIAAAAAEAISARRFDDALDAARNIPIAADRAACLARLAGRMKPMREDARSRRAFADALREARGAGAARDAALSAVIAELCSAGEHALAMDAASGMTPGKGRDDVRTRLVDALVEARQLGDAERTAREVDDAGASAAALARVAAAFDRGQSRSHAQQLFDDSLALASTVPAGADRRSARLALVASLAAAKEDDRLLRLHTDLRAGVTALDDVEEQDAALDDVALGLVAAGLGEQALTLTRDITSEGARTDTLTALVEELVQGQMFDQAAEAAAHIPDAAARHSAQARVAQLLAGAGRFDAARSLAQNIDDPALRPIVLMDVAKRQAEKESPEGAVALFREALGWVAELEDAEVRSESLAGIGSSIFVSGVAMEDLRAEVHAALLPYWRGSDLDS